MGLAEVRKYFEEHKIKNEIILLDANTATVDLAAAALGREPGEIAKTLSFQLKDGTPVLIVVMGTARIDNRKYKDYFGCKAAMLSHDDALEKIGHAVGGVCPFGVKDGVKIYLDVSLRKYETVFPAAGTANSAVAFTPDELEAATGGVWIDVCKDTEVKE